MHRSWVNDGPQSVKRNDNHFVYKTEIKDISSALVVGVKLTHSLGVIRVVIPIVWARCELSKHLMSNHLSGTISRP